MFTMSVGIDVSRAAYHRLVSLIFHILFQIGATQ